MPNAGLPELGKRRRALPADAGGAGRRARHVHPRVRPGPGRRLLRHDARAPPPGRRAGPAAAGSPPASRGRRPASRRSTSTCRSGRTRRTSRSASAPTPTAPRRSARRCSPRAGTTASRSPATRPATARTCSTSASTTSAATASPTCSAVASRLATASTLPLVLDSTEPAVIEAGLELLGGRSVVNSVNYEDGDGPESRFARVMPIVREHGAAVVALTIDEEGQARTAEWKVRVADPADRGPHRQLGDAGRGHHRRLPDLPDRHRPGGDPPRRARDDRGDPRGQARLPDGADHARRLQRLVRPQPGGPRRAQLGVPARVRQGRPRLGDRARGQDPADVAGSPTSSARSRSTWSTTGAARRAGYDPLQRFLELFEGVDIASARGEPGRGAGRAAAGRAAGAPDHRRRAQRPRGRPRRGARHRQARRSTSSTTTCSRA